MTGGYIRTNWRQAKAAVDVNVIGQGWQLGSFAGGAGAQFPNGGFVVVSINASTSDYSTAWRMDAMSAMNLFYGSNGGGAPLIGGTSGFKIIPIGAYVMTHLASASTACAIWASVTMSDDSVIQFYMGTSTVSAGTSASTYAHFVWQGFIVSSP
jgi:hypothetical protein